jgi:phage terminase large subunit
MSTVNVRIPRFLKFRSYQAPFWNAMLGGCKRSALIWHRRAGKDLTVLQWMIAAMFKRPGTYYYFFPSYAQAKKVIWDGQDKHGRPFLSNFPPECIAGRWEDELKLRLNIGNGNFSTFQLIGVDKLGQDKSGDSIVGTNAVGIVMSEYSLMSERAWNLMRPVLRENDGWAVFVYTPRGKNHGYKLYQNVKGLPGWFVSLKNVESTWRDAEGEDGRVVVTQEDIQADINEGMDPALVKQEYYCSFEGALSGSYYGDLIVQAREEGRIIELPFKGGAVDTAWDLGVDDATVIGFTQNAMTKNGPGLSWLDYEEGSGFGLEHYVQLLNRRHFSYGQHYGPHDLKVTEWGTGNTRLQLAQKLGLNFTVVPKLHVADGIQAVRRLLPISVFNSKTCEAPEYAGGGGSEYTMRRHGLIDGLMAYRREWDEKLATWRSTPVHDWASHIADMVRYRAIAYYDLSGEKQRDTYDSWADPRESERQSSYADDWSPYAE